LGGVCGETDDVDEVKAKWEAGVLGSEEGYVLIAGLGIIGASLEKGMQEAKAGIEESLELISAVFWWANGGSWLREDHHQIQYGLGLAKSCWTQA
jgi:hypothetical protein